MGQQQLLLIVLGAIIVGIAVVVGLQMFSDSASCVNIDATTIQAVHYASQAQAHYRRPTAVGGGGQSFGGWSLNETTEDARYTAAVSSQKVTITGTCKTAERQCGCHVRVVVTVGPKTTSTQVWR